MVNSNLLSRCDSQKIEPKEEPSNDKVDKDYKPHGIISRQSIKPPPEKHARRSKRNENAHLAAQEALEVCIPKQ